MLLGCHGSSAVPAPGDVSESNAVSESTLGPTEENADSAVAEITPAVGTDGVDHTTSIIEVLYRQDTDGIEQFASLLSTAEVLSERPNALLRKNLEYVPLSASIAQRYGLEIRHEVYLAGFNWAAFTVPPSIDGAEVLARIAAEFGPVVASTGFSGVARSGYIPNDPDFVNSTGFSGPQWGQRRIGCASAWDTTMGDPELLIGIVDTGVTLAHPELIGQVLDPEIHFPGQQLDVVNADNTVEDLDGHGTAVCGVVAAAIDNDLALAGVAPGCRVIPVKIADSGDFGAYADIIAGIELAAELGARVINNSWYGSQPSIAFRNSLAMLAAEDVLVIVCAGNKSTDTSAYPAAYDYCMSVGATDTLDSTTSFTNWGADVDIAAPGEDLRVLTHTGGYRDWWGTSFSAPMVAGGAAMLWSVAPELSLTNVRSILEQAGPSASGFTPEADVHRLSLGTALSSIPGIQAPAVSQLVMRDSVELTPTVSGEIQSVELYINEDLHAISDDEPWTFNVDLSSYGFEVLQLEFRALGLYTSVSDYMAILVDNSSSAFDLQAGFEEPPYNAIGYDARYLTTALLTELKQMSQAEWSAQDIADAGNGPAFWRSTNSGQTGKGMRYAHYASNYGSFETDVLVTRRIDLTHARSAQLDFYTKHNIESSGSDRGWALITADEGLTFTTLETAEQTAYYIGYIPEYYLQTIDLADWLGQQVRIVFLFESDASGAGDEVGEIAAWWLDEISVSGDWVALGGAAVNVDGIAGAVSGIDSIEATAVAPLYADHVNYWIDFAPFAQLDAYDLTQSAASVPFTTQFDLAEAMTLPNQLAVLWATPIGADDFQGEPVGTSFYLFNHLGDVNADGSVDEADTAAYAGVIGLTSNDAGYIPLFDSDLDGVITEADAGAVGYYYNGS